VLCRQIVRASVRLERLNGVMARYEMEFLLSAGFRGDLFESGLTHWCRSCTLREAGISEPCPLLILEERKWCQFILRMIKKN